MSHQLPTEYRHFSAEVQIELRVDDLTFSVWSIGPNEIVLCEAVDIRPGNAELSIFVDSAEFSWQVMLPEGAVPFSTEIYMVPRGPMKPVHGTGTDSCHNQDQ